MRHFVGATIIILALSATIVAAIFGKLASPILEGLAFVWFVAIVMTLGNWFWTRFERTVGEVRQIENQVKEIRGEHQNFSKQMREETQAHSQLRDELIQLQETIARKDLALQGKVLYWQRYYPEAIKSLTLTLESDAENYEALKFRGISYFRVADFPNAIADLTIVALILNDIETYLTLAEAELRESLFSDVEDHVKKALELGCKDKANCWTLIGEAQRQIDPGLAKASFDEALKHNPAHGPAIYSKVALLMDEGDYDGAIRLCTEAFERNPQDEACLVLRARSYLKRNEPGDMESLFDDLKKAKEINPRDLEISLGEGDAWVFIGLQATELERKKELIQKGIAVFTIGLNSMPSIHKPIFLNKISHAYCLIRDYRKGIEHAKQSVAENSRYIQNHLTLTTALLANRQWVAACEAAKEGLKFGRGRAGRIHCRFFLILGLVFSGDTQTLPGELRNLVSELGAAPWFNPSLWDWSYARQAVFDSISGLQQQSQDMVNDLIKAFEGDLSIDVLKKWLN